MDNSKLLKLVRKQGVEIAPDFEDAVVQILKFNESPLVSSVFPKFRRGSKAHQLLRSLRENRVVRPLEGDQWKKDKHIALARNGKKIRNTSARQSDTATDGIDVFVSYAHKDQKWKDVFLKFLRPYVREGSVTAWDDQEIRPGDDWLSTQMNSWQSLLSVHLATSHDCYSEEGRVPEKLPCFNGLLFLPHFGAIRPSVG